MSTVPNGEQQPKQVRGEIKLSWKSAITEAWSKRGKAHIIKAVLVSSILGIFNMLQDGINSGLLRWVALGAVFFIINVWDDARLHRKASRNAWWVVPTAKIAQVE